MQNDERLRRINFYAQAGRTAIREGRLGHGTGEGRGKSWVYFENIEILAACTDSFVQANAEKFRDSDAAAAGPDCLLST
jgi:hypothetical protein